MVQEEKKDEDFACLACGDKLKKDDYLLCFKCVKRKIIVKGGISTENKACPRCGMFNCRRH